MANEKDQKFNPKMTKILEKIAIGGAEFFGTAILVFISCMGASKWIVGGDLPLLHSSFAAGTAVTIAIHSTLWKHDYIFAASFSYCGSYVLIAIRKHAAKWSCQTRAMFCSDCIHARKCCFAEIFGHISGAHVNPVTTVGALIMEKITLDLVPVYIMAQLSGAVVGYGFVMVVTPHHLIRPENASLPQHGIGMNIPSPEISPSQALAVEILISLVLTFANCSSWDPRTKHLIDSVSLRFGFIVAGINFAAASYTGASMNPARSFGPAVWNNDWELHWIYWVGPLTSAVLGSSIYRFLFLKIYSNSNVEPIS